MSHEAQVFEFGPYRLHPGEGVLLRGEEVVALTVKAFAVLTALVENRGHVVQKAELLRAAWPDCFVEENNLAQCIAAVRRALGEDPRQPRYIETISRRGYRFIAPVRPAAAPAQAAPRQQALGILPFRCIGSECEDYWGIGIADALINRLSGTPGILVRPTASVLRYAGSDPEWASAGARLQVDCLLTGCVQRSGGRIRVTVQLVSAPDGAAMWSAQFEDFFTDIFAAEDSISRQVARTLVPQVTGAGVALRRRHTDSAEAHQAYLRGRYFWNRRTEPDLLKSVRSFQRAVEVDPGYALAYVGLADAYTVLGGYCDLAPADSYPRARVAALQALELDEDLAEAYTPLGDVRQYYDWDCAGAEGAYRRALDLRPDYATAHHFYGWHWIARGEFDRAEAELRRAQELDPLSAIIATQAGLPRYFRRDYAGAVEQFERALELEPGFAMAHFCLGRALLFGGERTQALASLGRAAELSPDRPILLATLCYAQAVSGLRTEAEAGLQGLLETARRRYASPYHVAAVCAALNRKDAAFEWLDRAYRDRSNHLVLATVDPLLDPMRGHGRLNELIARVGFGGARRAGAAG